MSRSSKSWFDKGADAFARISIGGHPPCYVCPLCGRGFLTADRLTREHAPPQALGGRPVTLTCRECNSRFGHKLDDEMLALEQTHDFAARRMSQPARARLAMGGQKLNVDTLVAGNSILVSIPPSVNNPSAQRTLRAYLEQLAAKGTREDCQLELTLSQGVDYRAAQLGWLRAAYLAAFAALGYTYMFSQELRLVRQQLENPDTKLLDCFGATVANTSPTERRILIVDQPEELRSLSVQMGRHLIFLPRLDDGIDLYDRLKVRRAQHGGRFDMNFSGKLVSWPKGPVFALDFM